MPTYTYKPLGETMYIPVFVSIISLEVSDALVISSSAFDVPSDFLQTIQHL